MCYRALRNMPDTERRIAMARNKFKLSTCKMGPVDGHRALRLDALSSCWPALVLAVVLLSALSMEIATTASVEEKGTGSDEQKGEYVGSMSCRECHEQFYTLWATSHHGLAMQPYTAEFARENLTAQTDFIEVGPYRYRADVGEDAGWVYAEGPDGNETYPIVHVMGGKDVYYFLTLMEDGRLQTLPVAYDVHQKEWYDMAESAVRHFTDREDEALDWRERPYTFNTSCYSCHVSQLSTNYDFGSDTYHTVWVEPGINCETCHSSGTEHVRACRELPPGEAPDDLKIIVTREFSPEQINSLCAPCHAKMHPLTTTFQPGDRYFDHYDLSTLEHPDFYPDGRDLGENYTYTLWRMSPCVKSSRIDCAHCHTSSGRYRFAGEDTNRACLPCHQNHVDEPTAHSHHQAGSTGNECVACHMPMTWFARMARSDHSMRAPTPAATIEFGSPNACNLCHDDQDAAWADRWVREWYERDYQAPVLESARLVDAARKQDWDRLPDMLTYLKNADRDEIVATSLIRLLRSCDAPAKWPAMIEALNDSSPLVRSSAAETLSAHLTPESVDALVECTRDESRLVRIRAASALAGLPREALEQNDRRSVDRAVAELERSLKSRPDDPHSHYNLGNFYMSRGEHNRAIDSFETALRLQPNNLRALVNVSLAYNAIGQNNKAEASLRKALEIDPSSDAARLNLALLLAEFGRLDEAETAFRATLDANPKCAVAAYNLGVLLIKDRTEDAVRWCRKAHDLQPDNPKYSYTYAYCLYQSGDVRNAIRVLQTMIDKKTTYAAAYSLLGNIYEEQDSKDDAIEVYRQGLDNEALTVQDYRILEMKARNR